MKKFKLTDEHLLRKVHDHLKSFDKFDKLTINVEEIDVANVELVVEIGDDFKYVENLPHRDRILGIPEMTEDSIEYLSYQVKFFEDVDRLLGSELFRKHYRSKRSDYSLGETVLDGVKYEFHFAHTSSFTDFAISIKFAKVENGLKFDTEISTEDWVDYRELEQTWSKLEKILNQNKEKSL